MFSRRRFLQASAVAAAAGAGSSLAGCTSEPGPVSPTVLPSVGSSAQSPTFGADEALRSGVAQSEVDLLAAYAAAIAAHPLLEAELATFAAAHRSHVQAVISHEPPEISALPLDRTPQSTLRWLARLEAAAADQRAGAAGAAESAELGSLLALVAASEAQHEVVLADLAARADQGAPEPSRAKS